MTNRRQTKEQKEKKYSKIFELYQQGLNDHEIARQLDIHHSGVAYIRKKNGLASVIPRGLPPEKVDETHSRCKNCQQVVLNTDFPWVIGRADGRRLSICRKCRYKQTRQALGASPEAYWRDKQGRLKRNVRKWNYDLPNNYLLQIWNKQRGLCFYSDIPMVTTLGEGRNPYTGSVDRVDSTKGYVVGNLVLCVERINSFKRDATFEEMEKWMPDWYRRIKEAGFIE